MLYQLTYFVKADSNVTRKKNFPWKFEAIPTTVVPPVDLIVVICFTELRREGRNDVFVISLVNAFFMTKAVIYRKKENIQIPVIFFLSSVEWFWLYLYIYMYIKEKELFKTSGILHTVIISHSELAYPWWY